MKTLTQLPYVTLLMILAGGLVLAACGSPDPIPVFVTPTPALTATPQPTPAPITAGMVPVNAAPQQAGTPAATLPPGVNYGPIVGPEYTAQPLYTPLPNIPRERPCPAIITVPQVTLYGAPQRNAEAVGSAAERQQLTVREIYSDSEGLRWANTDAGWLLLSDGATQFATLGTLRSCAILAGEEPNTTLLGLHLLNWASQAQVLGLVRRLAEAGQPMGTLKGLSGAEGTLNETERISPQTVTIFRSIIHGFTSGDCPNGDNDPITEAREWIESLQRHWTKVNADYYEVNNECGARTEWVRDFSIEAMKAAHEYGQCLLLFSFPAGAPDIEEYETLVPVFEHILANPCASGRLHGIAMHAYTPNEAGRLSEASVWLAFRHRLVYDFLKQYIPNVTDVPVYYTEAGQGNGYTIESCEDITIDAIQYIYQLEEDPYVKGVNLWNVGTIPNVAWVDLTECLGTIGSALVDYYSE